MNDWLEREKESLKIHGNHTWNDISNGIRSLPLVRRPLARDGR